MILPMKIMNSFVLEPRLLFWAYGMLESQRVFFEARPGRKEFPVLERRGDSTSEQRREIT